MWGKVSSVLIIKVNPLMNIFFLCWIEGKKASHQKSFWLCYSCTPAKCYKYFIDIFCGIAHINMCTHVRRRMTNLLVSLNISLSLALESSIEYTIWCQDFFRCVCLFILSILIVKHVVLFNIGVGNVPCYVRRFASFLKKELNFYDGKI